LGSTGFPRPGQGAHGCHPERRPRIRLSMALEGMTEIGVKDLRASFRGELILPGDGARLAQVKRTYDPDNLFRVNHNIKPA